MYESIPDDGAAVAAAVAVLAHVLEGGLDHQVSALLQSLKQECNTIRYSL